MTTSNLLSSQKISTVMDQRRMKLRRRERDRE